MTQIRAPRCSVCRHPERWRIELLRAGGASLDALAEKFPDISRDSLHRHWTRHVSQEMRASYLAGPQALADLAETAAAEGASVLDYFRAVRTVLMGHLVATTEAGDARAAAAVAGQLVTTLEKIGKVTGEIASIAGNINVNVAIVNHPEFLQAQAALLRALGPYPEARAAAAAALQALDAEAPSDAPSRLIEAVPCPA